MGRRALCSFVPRSSGSNPAETVPHSDLSSGSKASRLRDFIIDFYNHASAPHQQNADDAFCAFVWSVLAQQPTVRVGLVPAGVTSEVWIAPQNSKRRKAKAKGEEIEEVLPAQLEVIEGAANRSLEELQAEYGDQLRIGIHQDAICTAITGSHIRVRVRVPGEVTQLMAGLEVFQTESHGLLHPSSRHPR